GDDAWVCTMYDEVRKFGYLGDTQFITGRIVEKRNDGERCLVDVEIAVTNQREMVTAIAKATIALPSREQGPVVLPEAPTALKRTATRIFARHNEMLAARRGSRN